jgi:hypothetical protein
MQLKGENKYKLAFSLVVEFKKLVLKIDDYRFLIYPLEEELEVWNEVIQQYYKYEDNLIKLMAVLNDYQLDKNNDKCMKDYVNKLVFNRYKRAYILKEDKTDIEICKDRAKQLIEINKILHRDKEHDAFGDEINEYFNFMNIRLRKYIK